ncbi:G patch domain and KOW motifs-containing protein-like protein [Dinothrombium tinctorium]|uniref:G patch domain and KOW motifs-containing protein-like protein n=1 Tax=Dinothrombium tinctorium TaxID=1965070 RepID=A0A3S3NRV0_9ACAR|nr:G patch domain and KOW motifs-containing protein-like protein [Dinothrombium tinctorium]RWS08405.1 G patch domain and KOW motifs-containing protein-like protein [Dinothrombium tinctorium]RWS10169.1 G patch domain and KOW motifs-containing protein-like protein [Dinothrombium tinctorium]
MEKKSFGFSFKKTKKHESKVNLKTAFHTEDDENVEKREYVSAISDRVIESNAPTIESKELIIPLIVNNNWRIREEKTNEDRKKRFKYENVEEKVRTDAVEASEKSEEQKLEERAKRELLKEAEIENESKGKQMVDNSKVIPLLLQNKIPEGFETDDRLDVSLRAEEPTLADYDKVPVEEFGLAMLRGMGWKPGSGVGKNNQIAKPIEVKIRPKGLGLGAEIPSWKQSKENDKQQEEELILKLNAFVQIEIGEYSGTYGQIEALDDELSRATIKPAIAGSCFTVPTAALRVVSKQEYLKDSKVLNKAKFDEYKERTDKRNANYREERHHH